MLAIYRHPPTHPTPHHPLWASHHVLLPDLLGSLRLPVTKAIY